MIIPWGTDAPIYHRPWATMALMAASITAFVLLDADAADEYSLVHGDGLHPVQWITSNFIHANIMHLAGNLIFLWSFALVVEGKVGFFPFLAIYLGLGFVQCGLEQMVTLGFAEGSSFGSSAIVYGLMAMALVWAPKNELNCLWFFGFRSNLVDMSILWFAVLYIALEVIEVVFWGAAMGVTAASAVLHLSGAALGFGLGTALLKLGWVDCEGWDLYAVMKGRQGQVRDTSGVEDEDPRAGRKTSRKKAVEASASPEDRAASATRKLKGHLESGSVVEAFGVYDRSVRSVAGWTPPDAEWLALIQALLAAEDWRDGVTVMEDYLRRSPKPSARVRLRLAQVLVKEQQRPAHAIKVLDGIPEGALPENLRATASQLRRQAERMREDGVLELEGEAW